VKVVRQDDPGVDLERALGSRDPDGIAQGFDFANQKLRGAVGQSDSKEDRSTGNAGAKVSGHRYTLETQTLTPP